MSYSGWPAYGAPQAGAPNPYQQYANLNPYSQPPQYPGYSQPQYAAPPSSASFYPAGYPASGSSQPASFPPVAPRAQSHYTYGSSRAMPGPSHTSNYYAAPPAYPQQNARLPQPSTSTADLNDPNVFRNYFRSGLRELTFNSRAIIEKLTALADQFSLRMATIVSDEIHTHLRTVPAHMKLPALYLTDMIAKNISHPYIALFARYMDRVFLQAYRDVDMPTKHKMEELLGSWRTGGVNGTEVYPERVMKSIEEGLYGVKGKGGGIGASGKGKSEAEHYNNGLQQKPSMASPNEVATLLQEIRHVLGISQAKAYRDPSDQANLNSLNLLQQLESTVSTVGATEDQARAIRQQLGELHLDSGDQAPQNYQALDNLSAMPPSAVSAILSGQTSLSDALSSLDPSLVATLGAIAGARPAARNPAEVAYEDKLFNGFEREQDQVGLTLAHINRPMPDAYQLLYDDLTLQCTQCAARWLETEQHHKVLQKHMDRHFRINNRLSGALRAQSRNWFVLEEDWLSAPLPEAEDPEKQEEAELAAEVARSFVKVPEDPIKASKPCPICKEKFKQQWNEAQEDFVWRDAKQVDGTIYHASCYLETRKARTQSKRAKTEGSLTSSLPPSREGTPQVPSPNKAQNGIASPSISTLPEVKTEEPELSVHDDPSTSINDSTASKREESQSQNPQQASSLPEVAQETKVKEEEVESQGPTPDAEVVSSGLESNNAAASIAPVGPTPSAPALALDSKLMSTLAEIVSRSNTPAVAAGIASAPAEVEAPAQAVSGQPAEESAEKHSRKRAIENMEATTDALEQAEKQAEPAAKKSKQQSEEHSDEESALYSVSAT